MRTENIFKPCLCDVYRDNNGVTYFLYVCHNFLSIKTSLSHPKPVFRMPFGHCQNPRLVRHLHLLLLTYVEKIADGCYQFRFLFPFQPLVHFCPDLTYRDVPSYSVSVLENELVLTIVCNRKISICHLKFQPEGNTYVMKRLPFYRNKNRILG